MAVVRSLLVLVIVVTAKIVQDGNPFWGAFSSGGVHLQNFDLLAAASKQRTIEKCRLTYGSEITIIISLRSTRRRLDQVFPSLALNPRRGGGFGRHCFSAFDAQPSGKLFGRKFPRFSAFMFAFASVLAHGWLSRSWKTLAASLYGW
jgi:hypothetical protein